MTPEELRALSATESAKYIRSGRITAVKLAEAHLDQIDRLEPTLHAWVTVCRDEALEEAGRRDHEAKLRRFRGALHGVPVGVKDVFFTKGLRTTAGSLLFDRFIPDHDATAVARLRRAGAVILGKTVTSEFASSPWPNGQPKTRNPWKPGHTPGGSSMGSGVAVATQMCAGALANQVGGSTLRPAAYNGVVGLKPTYGLISKFGVFPCAWSIDTVGVIVRSVEDAALFLNALAGKDPLDPSSASVPDQDYIEELEKWDRPPRIGLLRDFFYRRANEEVQRRTDDAAQVLAQHGAKVEEAQLPVKLELSQAAHSLVSGVEQASYFEPWLEKRPSGMSGPFAARVKVNLLIPARHYIQAQRLRRRLRELMVPVAERFDVLMTPSTPTPAPGTLKHTGDAVFQAPWSNLGFPAVSIPIGLAKNGLPLGVQLVGGPFSEARLLGVARWCEKAFGVQLTPPLA